MKRLFAALKIQPDPEFISRYRLLKQEMRNEPVKWVEEHNIHITLKFFGETEESRIPGISRVLANVASQRGPLSFRLKGLGVFGSSYAPRVVWAGIDPYEPLAGLMKDVHRDLRSEGWEPDRQNLVPHLTLGRIKSLRDRIFFQRTLDRYRDLTSLPVTPGTIILYESILRKEGPLYTPAGTYPFRKKELP